MENAILIIVLALILGGAIAYIVRAKRNGAKCIGCPASGTCGQKNSCGGCHSSAGCDCGCGGEDHVES